MDSRTTHTFGRTNPLGARPQVRVDLSDLPICELDDRGVSEVLDN